MYVYLTSLILYCCFSRPCNLGVQNKSQLQFSFISSSSFFFLAGIYISKVCCVAAVANYQQIRQRKPWSIRPDIQTEGSRQAGAQTPQGPFDLIAAFFPSFPFFFSLDTILPSLPHQQGSISTSSSQHHEPVAKSPHRARGLLLLDAYMSTCTLNYMHTNAATNTWTNMCMQNKEQSHTHTVHSRKHMNTQKHTLTNTQLLRRLLHCSTLHCSTMNWLLFCSQAVCEEGFSWIGLGGTLWKTPVYLDPFLKLYSFLRFCSPTSAHGWFLQKRPEEKTLC